MPRFRSMALRPVHRIKHVVDAEGTVDDTPVVVVDLINTVDAPVIGAPSNVETGSKVNGIYLKLEALHASGAGRPNFYMAIFKNPGNNLTTVPNPKAIGINDNKKFIIHQEMVLGSGDAGNGLPRVVFNGVIKIPRGYIRNGPSDKLQLLLVTGTAGVTFDWCIQCHYKEFR